MQFIATFNVQCKCKEDYGTFLLPSSGPFKIPTMPRAGLMIELEGWSLSYDMIIAGAGLLHLPSEYFRQLQIVPRILFVTSPPSALCIVVLMIDTRLQIKRDTRLISSLTRVFKHANQAKTTSAA